MALGRIPEDAMTTVCECCGNLCIPMADGDGYQTKAGVEVDVKVCPACDSNLGRQAYEIAAAALAAKK